jgi:hypothetical protein
MPAPKKQTTPKKGGKRTAKAKTAAKKRSTARTAAKPRTRAKTAAPKEKKAHGRPTGYTRPLGKAICKMLAAGMSLNEICKRPRIKARCSESTARGWAINPQHEFSANYACAKEASYHKMAEEIMAITDDGTNDYVERKKADGETYVALDHEHVQRSRLRVDTRKWFLSKVLPKIYGDKIMAEHTGPNGGPIQTQDMTPRDIGEDRLAHLASRYGGKQGLKVIEGGKKAG